MIRDRSQQFFWLWCIELKKVISYLHYQINWGLIVFRSFAIITNWIYTCAQHFTQSKTTISVSSNKWADFIKMLNFLIMYMHKSSWQHVKLRCKFHKILGQGCSFSAALKLTCHTPIIAFNTRITKMTMGSTNAVDWSSLSSNKANTCNRKCIKNKMKN